MSKTIQNQTAIIPMPAGDVDAPIMRVPVGGGKWTVTSVDFVTTKGLVQGDTNVASYKLAKGLDPKGALVDITAAIHNGNTGGAAWVAGEARPAAVIEAAAQVSEGEYLVVVSDDTGTVPTNAVAVIVDYVQGKR